MPLWTRYPTFAGIMGSKAEIRCPHSCGRCEDVREVREILLTAEELAREKGKKLALLEAKEHWNSIRPLLKCGLCQATEATWRTIHNKNPGYHEGKWIERHFKESALFLCPPCSGGNWFTHQSDTWEITTPDWSMVEHNTEANVWQDKRQKLLDNEVNGMLCEGWIEYRPNTHHLLESEMKLRQEEAEIRFHAEETSHYHEHPFKEATKNKPSATPNQSKEIAMKWKEDKENIDEANEYSEKLDSDIRKAILKRKTREQEIKDGNRKNGHEKHGANRKRLTARQQKETHT
jgi:hypothetical protein